jgi:uncharacterized membrane protein YgcG
MKFLIKSILTLSFILSCVAISAQQNSSVKLTVVDSTSKAPIEFATASVTPAGGTSPVKYGLTDQKGNVTMTGLAGGTYTLKIEFMGYITVSRSINIGSAKETNLGPIGMKEQVNTLSSITVSAIGNPILVKKDTIEYNASSFKTTDADVLENLLKKLPGIEVDADGKITANGKAINKIMIDGKTFFLDDPTIASKNLPAKIIDKVRVVERKSEQAQFTGIDDGNEETVIDLGIKPGMMNGLLGNVAGGYGTDDRYQVNGFTGKFTTSTQLAFFLNGNNTNNRGFQDMAGSMMSTGRGGGGGGGIRIGGMNFGGTGLTTSWMGAGSYRIATKNEKLNLGTSYMYSNSDNSVESKSLRQTFVEDSSFYYKRESNSDNQTQNHGVGIDLEYKFNDKTSILFRPNIGIGLGNFNQSSKDSTYENYGGTPSTINKATTNTYGNNDNQRINGTLLFRQRLNKPGRTFSVNTNYSYSNNNTTGYNYSNTQIGSNTPTVIDQMYNNDNKSYGLGARFSYTEPLGKNFYSEVAYTYNYNYQEYNKNTYAKNANSGLYEDEVAQYSTSFENIAVNQQIELNLRKNEEKYNYILGFNVQPAYLNNTGIRNGQDFDYRRSVVNYAPSARYEYNFSDVKVLRINYRGQTSQPSINQIQPVADNSNPLYQVVGNPDLLPEFRHNFELSYRNTNREIFKTYEARLNATYTMDKIINTTKYINGVQESSYINDKGVFSVNGFYMYSSPFSRTSKFFVSTSTRLGYNQGANYLNDVRNETTSLNASEQLKLIYKGTSLELNIGGNANFSRAWYTVQSNSNSATWTNSVLASMNWTLPAGFNLVSDLDYKFYYGFSSKIDPSAVWNAEASKTVLKGMGTLRVKIYDILKQARNISRVTNDSYIEDSETNILKQYVMFSFSLRFGKFTGQKGMFPGMRRPDGDYHGGRGGFPGGGFRTGGF